MDVYIDVEYWYVKFINDQVFVYNFRLYALT